VITGRNLGVACPECGTTDGWICECQLDPQISLGVPVFALDRHEDETGVSGPGRVAYGVVFPNGKTVLAWVVPDKPQSVPSPSTTASMICSPSTWGRTEERQS